MTLETLEFLQFCLHQVQLDGRAPDFEESARKVLAARQELADAIAGAKNGS